MTDDGDKSSTPVSLLSPVTAKATPSRRYRIVLFATGVALIAAVLAVVFWQAKENRGLPEVAGDMASLQQRTTELESKMRALDAEVSDLGTRLDGLAAAPAAAPTSSVPQNPKPPATDLARMQSDLVAVAAAVSGLQTEVKKTGSAAVAARTETETLLAETIAFLQLRDAALSGHEFAQALATMRTAAKNDPALEAPLGKLTPFAEQGAPGLPVLREQLTEQAGVAEHALAKTGAQSWWERVLAEFRGLVSIRPLHGTETENAPVEIMESDLTRDDLAAALDEMKNLPAEAQKILVDWRREAEARQTVDDALREIAGHLMANTSPAPAAPAQDAP